MRWNGEGISPMGLGACTCYLSVGEDSCWGRPMPVQLLKPGPGLDFFVLLNYHSLTKKQRNAIRLFLTNPELAGVSECPEHLDLEGVAQKGFLVGVCARRVPALQCLGERWSRGGGRLSKNRTSSGLVRCSQNSPPRGTSAASFSSAPVLRTGARTVYRTEPERCTARPEGSTLPTHHPWG